jgi:hypothetical protein
VFFESMLLRSIPVAAALAAFSAAPAEAVPALQPLKPCYVAATEEQREPVAVHGSGFTPLVTADILVDGAVQTTPTTTFDGKLDGEVPAPFVEEGERTFTLTVTETLAQQNTATQTSTVTRLAVEQTPAEASTRRRVRFRGRGFTDLTRPVYAHYVFGGRSRKTVRIGMPAGDCGLFSVRRRQFPFKKNPRVGMWTIQFDQEATYNPQAAIRVPLSVRVRRQIKPRRR